MIVRAGMFRLFVIRVFAVAAILLVGSHSLSAQTSSNITNKKNQKTRKTNSTKTTSATSKSEAVKTAAKAAKAANRKSEPAVLTKQLESAAIKFASEHHPELVTLFDRLKDENKSQYNRAIRELSTTSERLEKSRRYPDRYVQDLNKWKLDSRIRLILARLRMADPSEVDRLNSQLRDLVEQRTESRMAQLLGEKEKLEQRLAKTNAAIGDIEANRSDYINRELKRLERTLPKSKTKPSPKPTKQSIADRRKAKAAQVQSKASDATASERAQKIKQKKNATSKK